MYRFQTVLHTVFGFDRIFSGFSVLDDFFYGFAVSNRSQCHPPKRATLVLWHIKLQLAVRKLLRAGRFYTRGHKFTKSYNAHEMHVKCNPVTWKILKNILTIDMAIHAVDDATGKLFIYLHHVNWRRRELANPFAPYHRKGEQRVM